MSAGTEERCEFTDLLKSACSHCLEPRGKHRRPAVKPEYGPWFPARFDGECDGCGDRIEEGDQIRSDGEGGWLCQDCGEQ